MVFDERPMKRQPHYITNFCSRLRRPGLLIIGTHSYEDYLVIGRGVLRTTPVISVSLLLQREDDG